MFPVDGPQPAAESELRDEIAPSRQQISLLLRKMEFVGPVAEALDRG